MKGCARFACVLALAMGFIFATTYPFGFLAANHAKLTPQAAIFEQPGLIFWDGFNISPDTERVIIRLDARPYKTSQNGPARILTISRDHYRANVTIGQEGADLIVRLRRDTESALDRQPFVVPEVFDSQTVSAIEVLISKTDLVVEINGEQVLLQKLIYNPFAFWDAGYSLGLGNEHTWERPWIGEISAVEVTVDSSTVDLLASGSISNASIIQLLRHKLVLLSNSAVDLILNFIVMLPIGALTALAFHRHRIFLSIALWLVLAVAAETTQALIPQRIPALSDLVLNVAGVGAGAWLMIRFAGLAYVDEKNS